MLAIIIYEPEPQFLQLPTNPAPDPLEPDHFTAGMIEMRKDFFSDDEGLMEPFGEDLGNAHGYREPFMFHYEGDYAVSSYTIVFTPEER